MKKQQSIKASKEQLRFVKYRKLFRKQIARAFRYEPLPVWKKEESHE